MLVRNVLRITVAVFVLSIGVCGLGTLDAQAPSALRPKLVLFSTTKDADLSPPHARVPVVVASNGNMFYSANASQDQRLLLVDSLGRLIGKIGAVGDGPGEVRQPDPIAANGGVLVVWDPPLRRLSYWSDKGKFMSSRTVAGTAQLRSWMATGFVGFGLGPDRSWRPVILTEKDTAAQIVTLPSSVEIPKMSTAGSFPMVYGVWSAGIVVLDPNRYSLRFVDLAKSTVVTVSRAVTPLFPTEARAARFLTQSMQGRTLPPEQQKAALAEVLKTPLPQMALNSTPRTDARGRLWVLGFEGDSAFADVFTPQGFVTRMTVGCSGFDGSWNVNGTWLAVLCSPTDGAFEGDAVVKLFKIVG